MSLSAEREQEMRDQHFDRIEILQRIRAVEAGGPTSMERELSAALDASRAQAEALAEARDSLRLELEAEKHARLKGNEYLVGTIEAIRAAARKPNAAITNEWYYAFHRTVQELLPEWKTDDALAAYRKGQAHSADDPQREADREGA